MQQPSAWKRVLVSGALGRYTFSDNKDPGALEYHGGLVSALVDRSEPEGLVAASICLLALTVCFIFGFAVYKLLIWLTPSLSFWTVFISVLISATIGVSWSLIFRFIVLPFRWLRIRARRGLCVLIAKRVCPTELVYWQMMNQARATDPRT